MALLRQAEEDAKRRAAAEAEAKRLAEEALAKAQAERQKAEADARARAAEEAKSKAEADAKTRAEAEARAKADAEARTKTEAETRQKAEAEAKLKADAETERKTAEASETALRLGVPERQRIQVALTALGFDTRGTDGAFGARSREMIASWQKARNQSPASGYLTGTQHQALLREAAPAPQKFDDDQKKAEEEAKLKAAAVTPAPAPTTPAPGTAAPAAATPAPSPGTAGAAPAAAPAPPAAAPGTPAGEFDGVLSATSGIRSVTLRVSGTSATGTYSNPRCADSPVNLKVSASGEVSGDVILLGSSCGSFLYSARGRVANKQMQLSFSAAGGSVSGTLNLR